MSVVDEKYFNINKIETDFRAEAVAASFIESGIDAEKILILREKGDKRHVSKDISQINNDFSKQDLLEYLYIHTNRNSIYDTIPENIFHQPFNTGKKKTQEDVITEIRRHRTEEFYARRFFQPFEMIIDQLLVDVQLYERKYDKKNFHDNLKNILSSYWSVLKKLTVKQALFFIKIVPYINEILRDFYLVEVMMGAILDVPLKIHFGNRTKLNTTNIPKINSSDWKLGVNSVIGKTVYNGKHDIKIEVGPIQPTLVQWFSEGQQGNAILKELISMMLPANYKKEIKLKACAEQTKFVLSSPKQKAYLGINTRL